MSGIATCNRGSKILKYTHHKLNIKIAFSFSEHILHMKMVLLYFVCLQASRDGITVLPIIIKLFLTTAKVFFWNETHCFVLSNMNKISATKCTIQKIHSLGILISFSPMKERPIVGCTSIFSPLKHGFWGISR